MYIYAKKKKQNKKTKGSSAGAVSNVLNYGIVVSEFEL